MDYLDHHTVLLNSSLFRELDDATRLQLIDLILVIAQDAPSTESNPDTLYLTIPNEGEPTIETAPTPDGPPAHRLKISREELTSLIQKSVPESASICLAAVDAAQA